MDVVNTAINSAVITLVGLILAWLGKGQFEAFARRFDVVDQRFDAVDQRFDAQENRIDRLEQRLEHRIDVLKASVDAMRSDLTQVALAVGVRPRAPNG
jgi:hypothetical protein